MKHLKIFEEHFVKMKYNIREYDGTRPFKLDKDTGELWWTIESSGEYFLTYDEYLKLKDLNDSISKKCKLLDEQKKTTIEIFRAAIGKVVHDRPMNDTIKKYNL